MRRFCRTDWGVAAAKNRHMQATPTLIAPRPAPTGRTDIDAPWIQWVAEGLLRDCSPDSMVEAMVRAGFDRFYARAALEEVGGDPVFDAARRHQQLHRKLESVVESLQAVLQSAPNYGQVERRAGISADELMERYVCGMRPVILTDVATEWPALAKWTPQYLKERFGISIVEIQADRERDPQYEPNKLQHRDVTTMGEFVERVLAGGPTNDYYLTANNEVLRSEVYAPLLDEVGNLPSICDRSALAGRSSFWFGPAGTVTPLHHDSVMLFHTQIYGRKRWRLISPLDTPKVYNFNGYFSAVDLDRPDLARFPRFAQARVLDVILEQGETIFLPLAWWHHVTSLEVSISFSYTNLALPNDARYANPSIDNWV